MVMLLLPWKLACAQQGPGVPVSGYKGVWPEMHIDSASGSQEQAQPL